MARVGPQRHRKNKILLLYMEEFHRITPSLLWRKQVQLHNMQTSDLLFLSPQTKYECIKTADDLLYKSLITRNASFIDLVIPVNGILPENLIVFQSRKIPGLTSDPANEFFG